MKHRSLFQDMIKYRNESYTQYSTCLEVALRYYLKSRKIDHDYERLVQMLVTDRLRDSVEADLMDFVRAQELESWL